MNFANLFISVAEAQQANAAAPAQGSTFQMFLPMILVFVIFYFLMIRPQAKQKKQHQLLLAGLKRGDEVVTTAGIHGKVSMVTDNVVTIEIADNVRIKMEKQHVALVKTSAAA